MRAFMPPPWTDSKQINPKAFKFKHFEFVQKSSDRCFDFWWSARVVPYSFDLQLNNYSFKQFGVSCELGYELVALALDSSSDKTGERHCGRLLNVCFYLKTIVALI